jgi:glycosyltransferase involved in cell wall biosynthesis
LRILYIITRSEPGGAQTHVLDLLREFRQRAELHLGVGESGFLVTRAEALGIRVHHLPNLVQPLSPIQDGRAITEVVTLIRKVQPDFIHLHSSKAGLVGRLAARLTKTPSVFTAHGWAFTDGVPKRRRMIALTSERLAGGLDSWIIAVSERDRQLALQHRIVRPDRIVTIHNGIPDLEPDLSASSRGQSVPRLVMVARFTPQKEQTALLRALAWLTDLHWEVELIGDGPLLKASQELADSLGIAAKVSFAGMCNDVASRLSEADIFVLISRYEGFPISILEAMRAGLPVVASDVGGVSEAVIEGRTGFLVPRGDDETLQMRLRELLSNKPLRQEMGREGRLRYKEMFTLEHMIAATTHVYESL